MGGEIPALGILIDIPLGILMWAAMLRFLLAMVMKEDNLFVLMRVLNGLINPLVSAIKILAPVWIIYRVLPVYLALLLFVLRYYVAPLIIGYDLSGLYELPLEKLIITAWRDLGLQT